MFRLISFHFVLLRNIAKNEFTTHKNIFHIRSSKIGLLLSEFAIINVENIVSNAIYIIQQSIE